MLPRRPCFFRIGLILALGAYIGVNMASEAIHSAAHQITGPAHHEADFVASPRSTAALAQTTSSTPSCSFFQLVEALRSTPQLAASNASDFLGWQLYRPHLPPSLDQLLLRTDIDSLGARGPPAV